MFLSPLLGDPVTAVLQFNVEQYLHIDSLKHLAVPGFNGLPVYVRLEREYGFAHGALDWVQRPVLTARELAMLQVINDLTNKKNRYLMKALSRSGEKKLDPSP